MKPPITARAPESTSPFLAPSASVDAGENSTAPSLSTRELVIRLFYEERLSFPEIARRLGVTRSWVYAIAATERLRRESEGKDAPLGCLVCGESPVPPRKLRANGLCARHAYRLAKYGDPEAELPTERPSACESCGRQCGRRGKSVEVSESSGGNGHEPPSRSGRILGADGLYRCQRCAWREDPEFRTRHRKAARAWQVRARGIRILNDAREELRLRIAEGHVSRKEYAAVCGVLDDALRRLTRKSDA